MARLPILGPTSLKILFCLLFSDIPQILVQKVRTSYNFIYNLIIRY